MRLVKRDAAFGERQRLLVVMLQHRDVCLVAADDGEDVVGVHHRGEAFGLPQGGHCLFVAAQLGERHSRERVNQSEVPPVAGGVQRGGGLRDVLTEDREVADLPIALAELVVGQADGGRVVGGLRVLQRTDEETDGARLIAAR